MMATDWRVESIVGRKHLMRSWGMSSGHPLLFHTVCLSSPLPRTLLFVSFRLKLCQRWHIRQPPQIYSYSTQRWTELGHAGCSEAGHGMRATFTSCLDAMDFELDMCAWGILVDDEPDSLVKRCLIICTFSTAMFLPRLLLVCPSNINKSSGCFGCFCGLTRIHNNPALCKSGNNTFDTRDLRCSILWEAGEVKFVRANPG